VNKLLTISITSLTSLVLLTSACGGDDGDSGGSSDRNNVVDALLDEAGQEGLDLDRDCVSKLAAQLSDDDAEAIIKSLGTEEDPDVSEEADALAGQMFACVSSDSMVDQLMESIGSQPGMDQDCIRDVLEGLSSDDMAEIAASGGDTSSEVMSSLMSDIIPCMAAGG
jgi:hypothetical protein